MTKRFRVAFSFAGEKRDFVAQVAAILAEQFTKERILYDKFHEAEFARARLMLHLSDLYFEEADLVVAVLCPEYLEKDWTGLEWSAIFSLINQGGVDAVMLTRFGLVDGQGLHGSAGFLDLDELTPQQVAISIIERLAVNEKKDAALLQAASTQDWPEAAPALEWPVADHTVARGAFAELITRRSTFRLLPIQGASGTGKTHLTKQFFGNVFKMPKLACGLFNFKGTSGMDTEVSSFAMQLDVPVPGPGSGLTSQLTHILGSLKAKPRPTLLIFDTFEVAGEAEQWIKRGLLIEMIRSPWMRVVVIGQKSAQAFGEPWADLSAPTVVLTPPSAQEWYDYGKLHRGEGLTLDEVFTLYKFSNGSSVWLAQALGPALNG